MSENKTNNTVTCDSCGHSARIHPQLADKYVQPMAEIFKVLGDPTRIKILELLSHEDMCVSIPLFLISCDSCAMLSWSSFPSPAKKSFIR